jgi:rhodanese-related sulfurtransferase/SAM-dependent methyltransferase
VARVDEARHWEYRYRTNATDQVSWFEEVPAMSLKLIEDSGIPHDAAIIDVGGGASRLAAKLLSRGFSDVTVADLASTALATARAELQGDADSINWVECDVRNHDFGQLYDLWHDRAVFHFMVADDDRRAYLANLRRSLLQGGFVILATFGPDGPTSCSGLPVQRYGKERMANVLGEEFELVEEELNFHPTPSGGEQQFQYALFRRHTSPADPSSIEELLAQARTHLDRVSPDEAMSAIRRGATLVDIRSESQRTSDGVIPGSYFVPRNVLEWRLDPSSPYASPELSVRGLAVILICDEGYQSSLAAATLRNFGVDATDVIGGFQAWRGAGLPVDR